MEALTEDEVVLLKLTASNFLLHSVATDIDIDMHLLLPEDLLHFQNIVVC